MSKFARIVDNAAVDVVNSNPVGIFHPDIAAEFVTVPDEIQNGWRYNPETEEWSASPEIATVDTQPEIPQTVDVINFKLLFTSAERIKAEQLRATDAIINDFWLILDDPRTANVVMALPSIQSAIEYTLTKINEGGVTIDVQDRKAAILSGQLT